MLLSVENLEICYGVISALQDVSLQIAEKEIVTLIGANGAGKTTLLRSISGLLKPRAGVIRFAGNDITRLSPHRIVHAGVSHVPEGRQIFANLTVRENIELGGFQVRSHPELRRRADRCYSLFPVLAERREQRGGTLSGGEQQMLAIARALMAQPRLLLLDEPSLGLAPLIVRKIFQIITQINAEGTTVFLVEQNAHMALTIAHRAYVLQTGRVIKSDVASKLLEDPDVKKAYLGG